MNDDEAPPLPPFSWKRHQKLYRQLFARLWVYRLQSLGGDALRHVGKACSTIIGPSIPERHVQDTLVQYATMKLTAKLCDQMARQLASRLPDLMSGPLLRTTHVAGEGWHLVEIYQLEPQDKFGKPGRASKLYVVAGQLAGQYLTPWLHDNLLNYMAYSALGFSRRSTYEGDSQLLVGLRCWAYLRENEEQTEILYWTKNAVTDAHNRPILKLRMRFDVDVDQLSEKLAQQYSCPNRFDHYCHECPILAEKCQASPSRDHLLGYASDHQSGGGAGSPEDSGAAAQRSTGRET